ncbi:MAG TPA: MlaD family protein [Longimicrobiales bacterium]|nr:MlaD family protein [Longimicrobiales bacterium]
MDKRKRNIIAVGALAIVAAIVFFWGLYWLLGTPVLRGGMDVIVSLENGGGLKRSDRVHLKGVEVGSVSSVVLSRSGGVIVQLRVADNLALPADTRAAITGDVFGAHNLELIPGEAMLQLQSGDTIYGLTTPQLTDLASSLSVQVGSVLASADSLLAPAAIADMHATAAALPGSALELRAAMVELRAAAAALRRSTESLADAETGPALSRTIAEIERTAQSLNVAAENMGTSLNDFGSIMAKIDRGSGTLARMINDSSVYLELNEALREVRALATDIRQRPQRYIDLKIF